MQKTKAIAAMLLLGLGLGGAAACNRKGDGDAKAGTAAAAAGATAAPGAVKEDLEQEEQLLSARGDLIVNRKRISERRQELLKEREQLTSAAAPADPQALARIQTEDQKLLAEEQDLAKKERELLAKLEDVTKRAEKRIVEAAPGGGDPAAQMSRREAALARREAELAKREGDLTRREREHLALRSKALDDCRAQPVQTITRVEVPAGGGGRYGRKDIEPLMREVHKQMRARGILETDLPAAGPLFGAVSRANQNGDFTRAKFSAEQLLELVKSVRIDRAFIGAKIDRLSARMRGNALSGPTKGEVDRLFRQATASYGDGQFASSNTSLNRIYALLR
jgi:hypothetical protein